MPYAIEGRMIRPVSQGRALLRGYWLSEDGASLIEEKFPGEPSITDILRLDGKPYYADDLAGKSFSRQVRSDGLFGQPKGVRNHTLAFYKDRTMQDDAPTFFGNPPKRYEYRLVGRTLLVLDNGKLAATYTVAEDGKTMRSSTQAIFTLQN